MSILFCQKKSHKEFPGNFKMSPEEMP